MTTDDRKWTQIVAGPDTVEVRPAAIYHGINLRVQSPDGEVTLKPEEAIQLLLKIAAALETNAPTDAVRSSEPE